MGTDTMIMHGSAFVVSGINSQWRHNYYTLSFRTDYICTPENDHFNTFFPQVTHK